MRSPAILLTAAAFFLTVPAWAQSASTSSQDAAQHERGKQIFSDKCAQCHDVDAAKKLADGSTLLARLAAGRDPRALLATRLNKMSDEDHRAVVLYVEDLLARYRTSQKTNAAEPGNPRN